MPTAAKKRLNLSLKRQKLVIPSSFPPRYHIVFTGVPYGLLTLPCRVPLAKPPYPSLCVQATATVFHATTSRSTAVVDGPLTVGYIRAIVGSQLTPLASDLRSTLGNRYLVGNTPSPKSCHGCATPLRKRASSCVFLR